MTYLRFKRFWIQLSLLIFFLIILRVFALFCYVSHLINGHSCVNNYFKIHIGQGQNKTGIKRETRKVVHVVAPFLFTYFVSFLNLSMKKFCLFLCSVSLKSMPQKNVQLWFESRCELYLWCNCQPSWWKGS